MQRGAAVDQGLPDLRGALGATLSGAGVPTGRVEPSRWTSVGGGDPGCATWGRRWTANTARQTPREWCERGPPLRSDPNPAVEVGGASAGIEVVRQSGKQLPVPRDSREGGGAARKPGIRSASLTPRPRGRSRFRCRLTASPHQADRYRSPATPTGTCRPSRTPGAALERRAPFGCVGERSPRSRGWRGSGTTLEQRAKRTPRWMTTRGASGTKSVVFKRK